MAKNPDKPAYALVEPGKPAPEFDVTDQKGAKRSLKEMKGRWVVLYFYPKDDTSGCTIEACKFRDSLAEIKKRGAVVLGVSPDDAKSHQKFIDKFSLPFDLLADTEKSIANAYGVWQEKSMYGRKYMGVARTTYLIDPAGKVAHRWDKVKPADHDTEVLAKLDELTRK